MSLFGFLESAIKTVISPVTDLLDGDLTLGGTREHLSDSLSEIGDTISGQETEKLRK